MGLRLVPHYTQHIVDALHSQAMKHRVEEEREEGQQNQIELRPVAYDENRCLLLYEGSIPGDGVRKVGGREGYSNQHHHDAALQEPVLMLGGSLLGRAGDFCGIHSSS